MELNFAERKLLEKLYKDGEESISDLLLLQGKAMDEAIQELNEELAVDDKELWKVILKIQSGEFFQEKFEEAFFNSIMPIFQLAGESEAIGINSGAKWKIENKNATKFSKKLNKLVPAMNDMSSNHLLQSFKKAIKEGKTQSERALLVKEVSKQAATGEEGPFTMGRMKFLEECWNCLKFQ
ncbi:hypothetical protein [Brevibacillus daliensis]|uniref:hypothetical protein n=1 Tax=Brevibacillus daliensis TaxID=2892995 RepID=UPI001E3F8F32|nr:hypothetical protein [Brevibacillus daliensis]